MEKRKDLTQHQDFLHFAPLMDLRQSMDHLFEDFFSTSKPAAFMPKCNIYEDSKNYHIEIQVPGMAEEDLDISLDNHLLTISGETKTENKEDNKNYHRVEFSSSSINRSWELPPTVDVEHLAAHFKNGVLDVVLPKKEPSKISKKIKIHSH